MRVLLQKHIDEVMDEFDFNKVQKTMEFLGWKWAFAEEGVPREAELRKLVRDLMLRAHKDSMWNDVNWKVGTGGFMVKYHFEEDFFEVDFCLTRWTTEYLSHSEEVPF